MTKAKIMELAEEKLELDSQIKVLQARVDQIKMELLKEMGDDSSIDTTKYLITNQTQLQTRVDTQRLKADDLYDKYSKSVSCNYFKVIVK